MSTILLPPYYQGISLDLTNRENWVGIIGSRHASPLECEMASVFAKKCVAKGKLVVSGLAIGIDAYAHKGALEAGGQTLAIVNTTIQKPIYPDVNRPLGNFILQNGGLLHPFLAENTVYSDKKQFNNRLRERDILLAYLCPMIVVVKDEDSPITGGTRWATKFGMDYGQKVFRLDLNGKFHENPPITTDPKESTHVWWKQELDIEGFTKQYLSVA